MTHPRQPSPTWSVVVIVVAPDGATVSLTRFGEIVPGATTLAGLLAEGWEPVASAPCPNGGRAWREWTLRKITPARGLERKADTPDHHRAQLAALGRRRG